jgi:hypothetical protein
LKLAIVQQMGTAGSAEVTEGWSVAWQTRITTWARYLLSEVEIDPGSAAGRFTAFNGRKYSGILPVSAQH